MRKTIREAYGESLARRGLADPRVVILDADVSSSTRSQLFAAACPERFFNVGIAEANMVAMAAGLAAVGKIPFANTFAVFLSSIGLLAARTFGSYGGLNLKLAGGYGGLSDAFDGPSHHALEDLTVMRALPGFQVFVASDAVQTDWLVGNAIAVEGPMYLRFSRDAMPPLYDRRSAFAPGRGMVLRDGPDATVIACGVMTGIALEAARLLEAKGIGIRVVDMFCLKPLDKALVLQCAADTGAIVTAEEHSVLGGLGSAVAEVLASAGLGVRQEFVGLPDTHAECGPYPELLRKYGLDPAAVAAAVERVVKR